MDCITLTDAEKRICEWVGKKRRAHAIGMRRNPGAGPSAINRGDAANDIRGAECEFSASIILNVSWRPTIGHIDRPDVGGFIEVRSTVLPNGRLIIKPADKDGSPYVLIEKNEAQNWFACVGWIFAREAKIMPLITGHGDPAHFINRDELRSVDELRALISGHRMGSKQWDWIN